VAAFDSDADAANVFTSHFPGVPMAGDFDNITNGPDGPGTYKQAARQERVAFASPPCSDISVINDSRNESSKQARLIVRTVQSLSEGNIEVMVVWNLPISPKSVLCARRQAVCRDPTSRGGVTHSVCAAPDVHPRSIGGVQCRTRGLIAFVRMDVWQQCGAFMPSFTYIDGKGDDSAGSNYSLTLRDMLDPQTAESKSSVHSNVCVGNWQPTGYRHKVEFKGTQLEYTWVDVCEITEATLSLESTCPSPTRGASFQFPSVQRMRDMGFKCPTSFFSDTHAKTKARKKDSVCVSNCGVLGLES
jgi:hypothetical protein